MLPRRRRHVATSQWFASTTSFGKPCAWCGAVGMCVFSQKILKRPLPGDQGMRPKPARVTEVTTESIDARLLLKVLSDLKRGDFASRLPSEQTGLAGKIYDLLNDVIDLNDRMAKEFDRVCT